MYKLFGRLTSEFILEDSIHIVLFYIILASFYFFHISKDEEKDIFHIVQDTTGLNPHNDKITNAEKEIATKFQNEYSEEWNAIKTNALIKYKARKSENKSLIIKTILAGVGLAALLTLLNIYSYFNTAGKDRPHFADILKDTLLTVAILATIEILFFFLVVNKYKHISRDEIVYNLYYPYSIAGIQPSPTH